MFVYRLILLWELSLAGKLLPFLGVRRLRRRRENIEECHGVTTVTAMVAAFTLPRELLLLLFSAFSGCMCFAGLVVI